MSSPTTCLNMSARRLAETGLLCLDIMLTWHESPRGCQVWLSTADPWVSNHLEQGFTPEDPTASHPNTRELRRRRANTTRAAGSFLARRECGFSPAALGGLMPLQRLASVTSREGEGACGFLRSAHEACASMGEDSCLGCSPLPDGGDSCDRPRGGPGDYLIFRFD